MTLRHTRKRVFTKISVAGLLAATISLAEINIGNELKSEKSGDTIVKEAQKDSPESEQLTLQDLSNADLVKQLTNENFLIREEASDLIWRRGKPALSSLKEASLSSNPELISRSTELIRYIKVGISPDTPPHIAELVQSFESATNDGKEDILRELYAEKAYSQMLFMLSEMEDRALSEKLYEDFNRLAHHAARESIGKGDVEAAIEQLKMAPKSETSLRSLAYLYAQTGKLEAEIEKLKNMDDQLVDKEWEQHLYLESPRREDIRNYSQQESLMGVLANLDLLEGDPNLIYQYYAKKAPFIANTGLAILKAQYEGDSDGFIEKAHKQQLETLRLFEGNKPTDLLNQTMKSMCLTGASNLVEPYLLERYQYDSFAYLERRERPKQALAIVGITNEETLQKTIKETTRLALEELEMEQKDQRLFRGAEQISYAERLLIISEFYYNKGLPITAKEIITPFLKELEAQKNNEWYKVVEALANHRMHDLAIEIILDRGNGDDTYEQMVTYLYDDTIDTDLIWNTLLKREGITPEKSFRDLAVIMGIYQSEVKTYLQLQDELIRVATNQGLVRLESMRSALQSVAIFRQDAISAAKFSKQLLDNEKNKIAIPLRKLEYLRELSNCLNWKAIVTLLDADHSFIKNSARWYAVYSIAKRKLGDEKEADRLLSQAKLISMGLNDELRDIALENYLAGYYDISTEIIERMLLIGAVDRESNLYNFALGYLSGSDNAYINTQQWNKAAAFFMVKSAADLIEHPSNAETSNIAYYISDFYNAQFTRGMELYQAGEKSKGLKMLTKAHNAIVGDGTLADHFYPATRTTDLTKQYELWVEESHQYVQRSLDEFPECSNTHNTIAWILSRAVRKLDVALKHSETSLKITPFEASYIDTMGEIWHAKGDRKKAIEWGEEAVRASKYGRLDTLGRRASAKMRTYSLANQLERFRNHPHPKP